MPVLRDEVFPVPGAAGELEEVLAGLGSDSTEIFSLSFGLINGLSFSFKFHLQYIENA